MARSLAGVERMVGAEFGRYVVLSIHWVVGIRQGLFIHLNKGWAKRALLKPYVAGIERLWKKN